MIRIIVTGALGRMGTITAQKVTQAQDMELVAAVDVMSQGGTVLKSLDDFTGQADLIIDFSHHSATPHIMAWAAEHRVAVVMATTGHDEAERAAILSAAEKIPVFYAANMSLGIALLAELAKKTAAAFPDADIEIVETHHNRKLDAPSGTALMLAEAVRTVRPEAELCRGRAGLGKRTPQEIGLHAIRRGNVPGIHEIIISTDNQAITLKHEVYDRALFADGALAAARFIRGKSAGRYEMADIIR